MCFPLGDDAHAHFPGHGPVVSHTQPIAWCAGCAQNALQVVHQRVARLEDFVYVLQLSRWQSGMRQYALTCWQGEYLVQNGIVGATRLSCAESRTKWRGVQDAVMVVVG